MQDTATIETMKLAREAQSFSGTGCPTQSIEAASLDTVRIVSTPNMEIEADFSRNRWNVVADWYGQPRTVHSGSLAECIHYRKEKLMHDMTMAQAVGEEDFGPLSFTAEDMDGWDEGDFEAAMLAMDRDHDGCDCQD